MKIKVFITLVFSILGAWLASAYVYSVDMSSYPRLGKGSLPIMSELQDDSSSHSAPANAGSVAE